MNKHEIRWKGIAVKRETRSREMSRKRRRTRKEGSVDGYVVTGWLDSRLKWTRRRATRSYPIAAAATESSALNRASLHSLYYTYRYQPSTYGHARALASPKQEKRREMERERGKPRGRDRDGAIACINALYGRNLGAH